MICGKAEVPAIDACKPLTGMPNLGITAAKHLSTNAYSAQTFGAQYACSSPLWKGNSLCTICKQQQQHWEADSLSGLSDYSHTGWKQPRTKRLIVNGCRRMYLSLLVELYGLIWACACERGHAPWAATAC